MVKVYAAQDSRSEAADVDYRTVQRLRETFVMTATQARPLYIGFSQQTELMKLKIQANGPQIVSSDTLCGINDSLLTVCSPLQYLMMTVYVFPVQLNKQENIVIETKLEDRHSEECKLTPTLTYDLLTSNKCKCYVTVKLRSLQRPLANAY